MPQTIIQIETFMCPLGIGNLANNPACRFHTAADKIPADGLCPIHQLPLEKTTAPEDKITITIMDEAEVDTLIKYGDKIVPPTVADELDAAETEKATQETREPIVIPRTPLVKAETDAMKAKIQEDIVKFQALEDK